MSFSPVLRRELLEPGRKLANDESSRGHHHSLPAPTPGQRQTGDNAAGHESRPAGGAAARHHSLATPTPRRRQTGDNAAGHESHPGGGAARRHQSRKRHATAALATAEGSMAPRLPTSSATSSVSAATPVRVGARVLVKTPVVVKLSAVVVVAGAEDGYVEVVYDKYPPENPLYTARVAVDQIVVDTPPPAVTVVAPRRRSVNVGKQ